MKFNKILLLQQNSLGDVVLSTGMVRAFREQFPNSKIAFLVDPDEKELVNLPFIDELIPYTKGMPLFPVLRRIWRYDVAICLDFKYRSAVIPFLARIPVRAGIAHKRKLFLTHSIERPSDSEHMYFNQYLSKVIQQTIGLEITADTTQLCVVGASDSDLQMVDTVLPSQHSGSMRIAIAPFTSTHIKDWPIAYYAEFIDRLNQHNPLLEFVLLGGRADGMREFPVPDNMIDLRGRLKLTETAEVLRRVNYFIGSCSAPLHIATAVGTPALAFYGPTSPAKWAPVHQCVHLEHPQSCTPCDRIGYGKPCSGKKTCMAAITVDEALAGLQRLMRQFPIE